MFLEVATDSEELLHQKLSVSHKSTITLHEQTPRKQQILAMAYLDVIVCDIEVQVTDFPANTQSCCLDTAGAPTQADIS